MSSLARVRSSRSDGSDRTLAAAVSSPEEAWRGRFPEAGRRGEKDRPPTHKNQGLQEEGTPATRRFLGGLFRHSSGQCNLAESLVGPEPGRGDRVQRASVATERHCEHAVLRLVERSYRRGHVPVRRAPFGKFDQPHARLPGLSLAARQLESKLTSYARTGGLLLYLRVAQAHYRFPGLLLCRSHRHLHSKQQPGPAGLQARGHDGRRQLWHDLRGAQAEKG